MRTHDWKWTKGRRQVLNRDRVIHCYRVCRDKLGFTDEQARRFLKGTTHDRDVQEARRLYNERST